MDEPQAHIDPAASRLLSRLSRDVAMVLWPSFLASSIACLFFFAIFDPTEIGQGTQLADVFSEAHAGYALGFFSFWVFTTLSSALTLYLARTENQQNSATLTDDHHE